MRPADVAVQIVEPFQGLGVQVVHLLVQLGDLELGLEVDVVLDIPPDAVLRHLPVLAEQHEHREEDRLERHHQSEQAEGEGVEIGGVQPGSQRVLSRIQTAKKTTCIIRNGMLPENSAIQSAARSTVVRRSSASSLTLRVVVCRRSSTVRRSRLPIAEMMSRPAAGWTLKRWLRSSRSTASASRSSTTRTEAVREPPSRKETSPNTSPGPWRFEHHPLAGVVLEEDLHASRADDEHRAARVVDLEHQLAGRNAHLVELLGEDLALVGVEVLEERNGGEQRRVGRHREPPAEWPGEGGDTVVHLSGERTSPRRLLESLDEPRSDDLSHERGPAVCGPCHALDVVSSGPTPEAAREAVYEAVRAFLLTATDEGTLEEVLEECGYERRGDRWVCPDFIALEKHELAVAVFSMPRLTPLPWQTLEKIFLAARFRFARQVGSHRTYVKPGVARPIVIPAYDEVPISIIRSNLRTAGLSRDDFFELLVNL